MYEINTTGQQALQTCSLVGCPKLGVTLHWGSYRTQFKQWCCVSKP